MHRKTRLVFFTGLFLYTILAASVFARTVGDIVPLRSYYPVFTADLSEYKGKRVYLMNLNNQARDTTVWYYFSPDRQFYYGGNGRFTQPSEACRPWRSGRSRV